MSPILSSFLVNTYTHSLLARAMYTAIKHTKVNDKLQVNDKFQDPMYLPRAHKEKVCILLVMRVPSIVPLNFKPVSWSAPLSRELLVFKSSAMALEISEETFPGVKYPKLEVERGFRFWDAVLTAMHLEGAVLRELIDQFEAAEAWLAFARRNERL
ncbi:hypothetical protein B0H17DRAFT_1216063 [Mycena rosella]|uniref:Post-transcriptional regulator MKT1 C-terminal domain-containing protein n=1 Tax=Mycena rosella TaxID=1033263 RepID=A0AAD7CDC5_MYCRO|nr:hypothetical protein B0H17DRAFT_1216063 [Mycena rosella]